ncbi:DUF2971 domain-containing protein [Cocleimonas flava]|uniref:DUF2971 family protein n=1 Tax=Cocleimonas flava TaxID=634765 RepID=A0A4V2P957_9GAMM|nr:DUF2971 domain-containing protein [Cocleimonas flava]TCJ88325.1 DUF2971 family protein [Cocleimonas flava]
MYYKYRGISEWTENFLIKKEIWAAKPSSLNDPFECDIPAFTDAQLKGHIDKIKTNQLTGFVMAANQSHVSGESFFSIQGRSIKLLLNKIKKAKTLDKKYKVANNFYHSIGHNGFSDPKGQTNSLFKFLDKVGIFSLSEDPLNMLMWSHYGEDHKGLAYGFDANEGSDLSNEEYFQPVKYSDQALKVDLSKGLKNALDYYIDEYGQTKLKNRIEINDSQIQSVLFTKTNDWRYEKEWRYMREKFGTYPLPGKLSRIVFGLKCIPKDIERYKFLCKKHIDNKVVFYQVVRVEGGTTLDLKEV